MIEGLQISELLKFIETIKNASTYFPDVRDWMHVDRKWLCDVLYSLDADGFDKFVRKCLDDKRKRTETVKGLVVPIRAEFAEALKNASTVSSKCFGPIVYSQGLPQDHFLFSVALIVIRL
jgi:hypothetical protein